MHDGVPLLLDFVLCRSATALPDSVDLLSGETGGSLGFRVAAMFTSVNAMLPAASFPRAITLGCHAYSVLTCLPATLTPVVVSPATRFFRATWRTIRNVAFGLSLVA